MRLLPTDFEEEVPVGKPVSGLLSKEDAKGIGLERCGTTRTLGQASRSLAGQVSLIRVSGVVYGDDIGAI